MRKAEVFFNQQPAGFLIQEDSVGYVFEYRSDYRDFPVSWTLPVAGKRFTFENFPPFFDGLLPEGDQLEALLKKLKLDREDYLGQLIAIGADLIGAVTIRGVS